MASLIPRGLKNSHAPKRCAAPERLRSEAAEPASRALSHPRTEETVQTARREVEGKLSLLHLLCHTMPLHSLGTGAAGSLGSGFCWVFMLLNLSKDLAGLGDRLAWNRFRVFLGRLRNVTG